MPYAMSRVFAAGKVQTWVGPLHGFGMLLVLRVHAALKERLVGHPSFVRAATGLMTFAWSTGVQLTLAQRFQDQQMHVLKERREKRQDAP